MTANLTSDVVIIGSGLGGSTLAYGLVRNGLDVTLVERGDFLRPKSASLLPVYKSNLGGQPIVSGLSKVYGAAMYRLREIDFRPAETGNGPAPEWPIQYPELEGYYSEAEYLYKVHGSSENDVTDPPRSRPWPYPPIPHQGPAADLVKRLTERAGVSVSAIPRALDYDPENGGKCVLCQHCDAYYCPRDAKMDAETAALRPALQTGRMTLLTNTQCLQVLVSPNGRKASGVRLRRDGSEFLIHAPVIAVCAGLTESPQLLWRSRNSAHPHGLANSSGTLGRYMAAHTHAWLFPVAPGVQKHAFHQKTFAVNAFYESAPHFAHPCGTIQAAGYMEAWLSCRVPSRYAVEALLCNTFQVFAMTEAFPTRDTGYALSDGSATLLSWPAPNRKALTTLRNLAYDLFRSAGYLVLKPPQMATAWHPVGTARMGSDPRISITDAHCQAHDVEGLYVVDAGSLPRAGALNTGLTIAALALRAAHSISRALAAP